MSELDGLVWPIARDAAVSTDATGEPSGVRSLKLEPSTGEVLSARIQAALHDDVTIEYAYQQTDGSVLIAEWLDQEGVYRLIAQHENSGAPAGPFQTNTVVLPAESAFDGLRVRFRNGDGGPSGGDAFVDDVSVTGVPALPSAFSLLSPLDGATGVGTVFVFDWEDADLASSYRVVLDDDEDFSSPLLDTNISISTFFTPFGFIQSATQYFWKVEAVNTNGTTLASPGVATFSTVGFVDACAGDCTGNGTVDFGDLVCMLGRFGSTDEDASADCDESGTVDFGDLVCALGLFGECP